MPLIYHDVSNYSGSYTNANTDGLSSIQCSKLDLIRCMITVGNPSFLTMQSIRRQGFLRALYTSLIAKAEIVSVNISSNSSGLCRHSIFDTYLSDQKRIVSYNLGMAFVKFYSQKILKVQNLMHVEQLKKQHAITFIPESGKREPDLVGQTKDQCWHVFEAKGVSTSPNQLPGKVEAAKNQAIQIKTVSGAIPETRNACATYIGSDQILTYLNDPPESRGELEIQMSNRQFLRAYYSPFLACRSAVEDTPERKTIDGTKFDLASLNVNGRELIVGLDSRISEYLDGDSEEFSESIYRKLTEFSDRKSDEYSIGPDGFLMYFASG